MGRGGKVEYEDSWMREQESRETIEKKTGERKEHLREEWCLEQTGINREPLG